MSEEDIGKELIKWEGDEVMSLVAVDGLYYYHLKRVAESFKQMKQRNEREAMNYLESLKEPVGPIIDVLIEYMADEEGEENDE